MKIIESILKLNECFVTGKKIPIKGIMLHSVGVSQPSAQTFVRSWNTAKPGGRSVCVHAFLEQNGDVYQTLPWDYRAWHCGSGPKGSANDTHIGVEMTEPSTIQYNPNGSWVDKDPAKTKSFILGTYNTAVELFAKLCKDFKLDPLKDGVIISHTEGNKRGIASNHGDVEHIWSRMGLTMDKFRADVKAKMGGGSTQQSSAQASSSTGTSIVGKSILPAQALAQYVLKNNPSPKLMGITALELAQAYLNEGTAEGIRGDLAFCQSCLETGCWSFGNDVKPEQNNFAGLGATGNGNPGNSFKTPQEGVRAQIQHLKAYASTEPLKGTCVDGRFSLVKRGCAPCLEDLTGKWAADTGYAGKILKIYNAVLATAPTVEASSDSADTIEEKLKVLISNSSIKSPDYWINALKTFKYFDGFVTAIWNKYEKK